MKNGYKVLWTAHATEELRDTITYLQSSFSDKEINALVRKIESIVKLIAHNPNLFIKSEQKDIHRVVIMKYNTMYYRVKNNNIEILSFYSNRKKPINKNL